MTSDYTKPLQNLDLGDMEEDRQIASLAVQFVLSGARKGNVHLCSRIAELLRENKR